MLICDLHTLMTEQHRNSFEWDSSQQQLNGEGIAESMRVAVRNCREFKQTSKRLLLRANKGKEKALPIC